MFFYHRACRGRGRKRREWRTVEPGWQGPLSAPWGGVGLGAPCAGSVGAPRSLRICTSPLCLRGDSGGDSGGLGCDGPGLTRDGWRHGPPFPGRHKQEVGLQGRRPAPGTSGSGRTQREHTELWPRQQGPGPPSPSQPPEPPSARACVQGSLQLHEETPPPW